MLTLMALAERWLGSLRWILVVATGHIGATLLVAYGLTQRLEDGLIPLRVTVATDVGPSYGISAMLGALTFRLRGPARWIWAVGLVLWWGGALWHGRTFTDYGHFFALFIGLAVGAIAVGLSHRFVKVMARKAARSAHGRAKGSAADRIPAGGLDRVGGAAQPLEESDGGLDQPRRDRPQHGHD